MITFTIDTDNNITAFTTADEASRAAEGATRFASLDELATVSAEWPMSRFVEIWSGMPGQTPVAKFQDRKRAVSRIWKAIQPLAGGVATNAQNVAEEAQVQPAAEKPAGRARSAKKATPGKAGKPGKKAGKANDKPAGDRTNKKAEVIAMMKRTKGATLAEIVEATAWQPHTVRGFVSILGSKGGETVESSKNAAGDRVYKIAK